MTNILQAGLELLLERFPLTPELQNAAARIASPVAPFLLPLNDREVSFERHPLDSLHHLLLSALGGQQTPNLGPMLQAVPDRLRNAIYFHVWDLATDPNKGGDRWGERNAMDDLPRLMNAVKAVAQERLESLPTPKKNSVYGTVYRMAHLPDVSDPQWGEHHAKDDTGRLIRALHRNNCLDIAGTKISWYAELEKNARFPSRPFHLYRQELAEGQICFINGMCTTFHAAREMALRLSHNSAQDRNVHCVYSATSDPASDVASGILGQGGIATPAVPLLLDQWQDFFETHGDSRLLQICHSRGAIEVNNALALLPPHLRQRIMVIAIAPACLIPEEMAFRVVNLVISSDPVPQIALNRHLLNAPHTVLLPDHTDSSNPHNMFGSSYLEWITPRLDAYIRTNSLD